MFTVKVDITSAIKALDDIQKRQLPFAMANSLTQTAKQGQNAMLTRLPYIFTLRNTWTARGIRIVPASKRDDEPFSVVFADTSGPRSLNNYLLLQDTGGEKVTHMGRKYICVPIRQNLKVSQTGLIPDAMRPKALIDSGRGFKVQMKDGRLFLFMRVGTGDHHTSIVPVYRMVSEVHVKAVLDLEKIVKDIADQNFSENFDEAMAEATRMLTL
jgi:hypothetical protein